MIQRPLLATLLLICAAGTALAQSPCWFKQAEIPGGAAAVERISESDDGTLVVDVRSADGARRHSLAFDAATGALTASAALPNRCADGVTVAGGVSYTAEPLASGEGFTLEVRPVDAACTPGAAQRTDYAVVFEDTLTPERIVLAAPTVPEGGQRLVYVHGAVAYAPDEDGFQRFREFVYAIDPSDGEVVHDFKMSELQNERFFEVHGVFEVTPAGCYSSTSRYFSGRYYYRNDFAGGGDAFRRLPVSYSGELDEALTVSESGVYAATAGIEFQIGYNDVVVFDEATSVRSRTVSIALPPEETAYKRPISQVLDIGPEGHLLIGGSLHGSGSFPRTPSEAQGAFLYHANRAGERVNSWVVLADEDYDVQAGLVSTAAGTDGGVYGVGLRNDGRVFALRLADGCQLDLSTGIEEEDVATDFRVGPNPTTGDVFASTRGGSLAGETYAVLDAVGRRVRSGVFGEGGRIRLGGLAEGLYVVTVPALGARQVVMLRY